MNPIKATVIEPGHYRVLAIPFGGPAKGKDLDGDYFSPRTDIKSSWFQERPVLFHHGKDPWISDTQIGKETDLTKEADGWWSDIWLDRQNRFFSQIDKMITDRRMFASSGTMQHLISKKADGEILRWPHVEHTLSPVPRNPYAVVRATKALSDFEEAGIEIHPALAEILESVELLHLPPDLSEGEGAAKSTLNEALNDLEALLERIKHWTPSSGSRS